MKNYMLEICVDSVESALIATKAGAKRLELCSNLVIGGTTPGKSLYEEIRKSTDIPIHALIRPRYGDFCYTDAEFAMIQKEVSEYALAGCNGVVIGILNPDGTLDEKRMERLVKEAEGMHVTLHRAFDMCKDPFATMQKAIDLGIQTILTSGQENNSMDGAKLLKELIIKSEKKINILVGSGVNAAVIPTLYEKTGATQYHMSGKCIVESAMQYRKQGVTMGIGEMDEYGIWRTNKEEVENAVAKLESL